MAARTGSRPLSQSQRLALAALRGVPYPVPVQVKGRSQFCGRIEPVGKTREPALRTKSGGRQNFR